MTSRVLETGHRPLGCLARVFSNRSSRGMRLWALAASLCASACGNSKPVDHSASNESSTSQGGGSSTTLGAAGSAGEQDTGSSSSGSGTPTCNEPTPGATGVCADYKPSTIADMRQGQRSGCFELAHVALVARTPSPTEPRLYLQDIDGADFSAIVAKCSADASHACSGAVKERIPKLYLTLGSGDKVTLRGYYLYGSVSQFEQLYIEDIIDECRAVQRPDPVVLTPSDIARDSRVPEHWFRRATVDVAEDDPLLMYDFSPADLSLEQPQCPDWGGFAMIPQSQAGAMAQGCDGNTNPASRELDPAEILIGRQFFDQFLFSADCACANISGQTLVTPTSSVSGTVGGYLTLEVDQGSTDSYQVFEAAANQSFPIQ